jgi:hypothetical protein
MTGTPSPPPHEAHSFWKFLAPGLPILAGLVILVLLAAALNPPVQIAGDGALKQYVLHSWLETGRISSEIDWAAPEPWLHEIWSEFHFPFEAPFVYDGKVVFPPFFLLLSLPFFMLFGFPGLFILPALSLVGLWLVVLAILRQANVRGLPAVLALTALVFSPLTYFGMMFWEHTPALFALFAGFALLMRRTPRPWVDGAAGFLLALAVMLRPELVIAAAVWFLVALAVPPRRPFSTVGVVLGVVLWAAINLAMTGTPPGIHARQSFYLAGGSIPVKLLEYWVGVALEASAGQTAAFAALLASAVLLSRRRVGERRLDAALVAAAGLSVLLLPFMIPYSGEYLGFRRFELLLIPVGAILAGRLAAWDRRAILILLALCLFQAPRFVRQFEVFGWANGPRLAPVIESVETFRPAAILADSQFTAIELSWLMPQVPLAWGAPPGELERLAGEVAVRTDIQRVAIVFWQAGGLPSVTLPIASGDPVRWVRVAGSDHGFALFLPEALISEEFENPAAVSE